MGKGAKSKKKYDGPDGYNQAQKRKERQHKKPDLSPFRKGVKKRKSGK